MKEFKYIALFGNIIFILWILYNAIDEGFRDIGNVQTVLPIVLLFLLVLNCVLLLRRK